MARHFGWSAVAGPDPMDWPTYALARQYLVEEFVGTKIREARALEDAEARHTAQALERRR